MLKIIDIKDNTKPEYKIEFPPNTQNLVCILLCVSEEEHTRLAKSEALARPIEEISEQSWFEGLPLSVKDLFFKLVEVQRYAKHSYKHSKNQSIPEKKKTGD